MKIPTDIKSWFTIDGAAAGEKTDAKVVYDPRALATLWPTEVMRKRLSNIKKLVGSRASKIEQAQIDAQERLLDGHTQARIIFGAGLFRLAQQFGVDPGGNYTDRRLSQHDFHVAECTLICHELAHFIEFSDKEESRVLQEGWGFLGNEKPVETTAALEREIRVFGIQLRLMQWFGLLPWSAGRASQAREKAWFSADRVLGLMADPNFADDPMVRLPRRAVELWIGDEFLQIERAAEEKHKIKSCVLSYAAGLKIEELWSRWQARVRFVNETAVATEASGGFAIERSAFKHKHFGWCGKEMPYRLVLKNALYSFVEYSVLPIKPFDSCSEAERFSQHKSNCLKLGAEVREPWEAPSALGLSEAQWWALRGIPLRDENGEIVTG